MTPAPTWLRPTPILRGRAASEAWLARQYRDPYVKARLQFAYSYRSRSAFKLIDLNAKWKFLDLPDVRTVVDLGAAPGGWSQVVAGKMGWTEEDWETDLTRQMKKRGRQREESALAPTTRFGLKRKREKREWAEQDWSTAPLEGEKWLGDPEDVDFTKLLDDNEVRAPTRHIVNGTLVAVDLLKIHPIPGVRTLQMDFLSPEADAIISGVLKEPSLTATMAGADGTFELGDGKADVILSDMAANFAGNAIADNESSLTICNSVFQFVCRHLRTAKSVGRWKGGVLVLKHFATPQAEVFRRKILVPNFNLVAYEKPRSSRPESPEGYWVCMGWKGPPGRWERGRSMSPSVAS